MSALRARLRACFVNDLSGGYSCGVPPLPIPNREVKPARADGTAMQCGRVGRRLLLMGALVPITEQGHFFFVLYLSHIMNFLNINRVLSNKKVKIMSDIIFFTIFAID